MRNILSFLLLGIYNFCYFFVLFSFSCTKFRFVFLVNIFSVYVDVEFLYIFANINLYRWLNQLFYYDEPYILRLYIKWKL